MNVTAVEHRFLDREQVAGGASMILFFLPLELHHPNYSASKNATPNHPINLNLLFSGRRSQ